MSNYVAVIRRTPWQHLWDRLGFGERHPDMSNLEDDPRFAPGALVTVTKTYVSWDDRLRILLSGRIVVRARTVTDVPIQLAITRSSFSVLAPGSAFP